MADQTRKPPVKRQMHYDPSVMGVWKGFGGDLHPWCGQSESILVTNVTEAVDCLKCLRKMEQSAT